MQAFRIGFGLKGNSMKRVRKDFVNNAVKIVRAVLINQIARYCPRLYINLSGQTGRGGGEESSHEIARYFVMCFEEYFARLGLKGDEISNYLRGKRVFEYGPGDVPGVAFLMLAHGAESVTCIDRFPMYSHTKKDVEVLEILMAGLEGDDRIRGSNCFLDNNNPASGFSPQRLRYIVRPSGLSALSESADLIVSRAVLEHVDDLSATFGDMYNALHPMGIAIHQVDLESHGLHRENPLDFLTWSPNLWSWMFGNRGYINRMRIDYYRHTLVENNLEVVTLEPTKLAGIDVIKEVRPCLSEPFRGLSDKDLSWLGFWLICRRGSHPSEN